MLFKRLLCLLAATSSVAAAIITKTVSLSTVTATECKTLLGPSSRSPIPTTTTTKSLAPQVLVLISVSTPVKTVTPRAITVTETEQVLTTTTTTNSAVTGTFSTTTTVFETLSMTTTETAFSTELLVETSTITATNGVPTLPGFKFVEDSTGLRDPNPEEETESAPQQAGLQDTEFQQPLLRSRRSAAPDHRRIPGPPGRGNPFPPGHRVPFPPAPPGHKCPWNDRYPSSVNCVKAVRTQYVKLIIFAKPFYRTTTIPAATSTATTKKTMTSVSTIVPPSVTETESFSTTVATTTTFTSSITETTSITETIEASITVTSYAACASQNILGPQIEGNRNILGVGANDGSPSRIQDVQPGTNAYDCCVTCVTSSQNCQYSVFIPTYGLCGRILNTDTCPGPSFDAGGLYLVESEKGDPSGYVISNGPCASFRQ
ncbi:MAG: hypothetical protein Q9222_001923 [Ikaeria aurantiellina]